MVTTNKYHDEDAQPSQPFDENDAERAIDALLDCLKATKQSLVQRGGKGQSRVVEETPDHKIRIEAAKLLMAYVYGPPVAKAQKCDDTSKKEHEPPTSIQAMLLQNQGLRQRIIDDLSQLGDTSKS